MGEPGQTPVLHVKAGGGALFDAACRAALIACHIDPDSFGTYDDRLKAQGAEREKYRAKVTEKVGEGKPHPSPCTYPATPPCQCYRSQEAYDDYMKQKGGAGAWLRMNSQSGHMSRDEWYRAQGSREDPCANYPPGPGPDGQLTAGGYGYSCGDAFCTDHAGLSRGQEHWMICKLEREFGKDVAADPQLKGMMPESTLGQQVDKTVDRMADDKASHPGGQSVSPLGKLSPEAIERGKKIDEARAQMAKEKAAEDAKKAVDGAAKPTGEKPNDVSDADPAKTDRDKAKKCIRDAWQQSVKDMKQKAVDESGLVNARKQEAVDAHNAKGPPKVENYDQLSQEEKDDVKRKVQQDMKDFGADKGLKDTASSEAKDPAPTKDDCRNFQGAWLFTHQDGSGNFPPTQGRAPGATPPSTNPTTSNEPQGDASL